MWTSRPEGRRGDRQTAKAVWGVALKARVERLNQPANVTVNGQNARNYEDGTFESLTNIGPGVQTINVQATDTNGNTTTQNWQVNTTGADGGSGETALRAARKGETSGSERVNCSGPASGAVPTHDIEGNLLTDGTYTYTWDARNRMTSVTKGSDTWSFQYDGQNRRISESKNGSLVRRFIWNGTRVMEERIEPQMSGQGLLTRRYWTGGMEMAEAGMDSQSNYYLHDHRGSLRVVVGDDGTNQIAALASYDYGPWGQRSELTGTTNSPHSPGYTGHWWHESGLSLAVYRPYDPATGRWSSRDPIEERGGINLYRMVANDAVGRVDYLGLEGQEVVLSFRYDQVIPVHTGSAIPPPGIPRVRHKVAVVDYTCKKDGATPVLNIKGVRWKDGSPSSPSVAFSAAIFCFSAGDHLDYKQGDITTSEYGRCVANDVTIIWKCEFGFSVDTPIGELFEIPTPQLGQHGATSETINIKCCCP